ncbi:MAG TPA: hypothetical protein VGB30_12355 [bacterium]|jgi:hypothetical protein
MRKIRCFLILSIVLILLASCSSGGGNPVTGSFPGDGSELTSQSGEVNHGNAYPGTWGYWDITIDPETWEAEIVPIRGIQLTLSVLKFLQPPDGNPANLSLHIIDFSGFQSSGRILMDLTLRHPFPGLLQFTGADVKGVFITSGTNSLEYEPGVNFTDFGINDAYMANPDGYTRWMNPNEFDEDGKIFTFVTGTLGKKSGSFATLNPYKYFSSDLGNDDDLYDFFTDPDNLKNRGQFLTGTANTRTYDLYFAFDGGSPKLNFQYAVLASWDQPQDLNPNDLPGSFPPGANTNEAFLLSVADDSTLYYTSTEAGGNIQLDLEVFDWSAYLGAASTVLSDIDRIIVESPNGLMPSPYVEFDSAALNSTMSPGTTAASSVFSIEITGCSPSAVEDQRLLIAVEHSGGANYGNNGFGTNYSTSPLTAYFFHTLKVSPDAPDDSQPVVDSIDPPHGIVDTVIYDVIISGSNFTGVDNVRLDGDFDEVPAAAFEVEDDSTIKCILDLNGLTPGFYDVYVDHPVNGSGFLADGFEVITTNTGIQSTGATYTTTAPFDSLFVAGLFSSGSDYEGNVITQNGHITWVRIDVPDPATDDMFASFFADKPSISTEYNDWTWSMDSDPVNNVFGFTTFDDDDDSGIWPDTQFDFVKIIDENDGSYIGAVDTNCGYAVAQVNFDEYGNLWAVCSNAYYPNFGFTLQRWDYDPGAPAPYYTKSGDWDLSSVIASDAVISDLVVLQRYRRLFISYSAPSWGVNIASFDFSSGEIEYITKVYTTAPSFYGVNSFQEVHQRYVDMDTDRTDSVLAGSRILVMLQGLSNGLRSVELRKYDVDLNMLGTSNIEFPDVCGETERFSNMELDDVNGGRVLCTYMHNVCASEPRMGVIDAPDDW